MPHHSTNGNAIPEETRQALEPEPGWERFRDGSWHDWPTFVNGTPGDGRLEVRYYRRIEDGALVGKIWFGPGAEGPPGYAHGGSMAALLDDAMGSAGWIAGHPVIAANISIDFRRKLVLNSVVELEAWVERIDGRKVYTRARLIGEDGETHAEGTGLFIKMSAESFGKLGAMAARAKADARDPKAQTQAEDATTDAQARTSVEKN